MVDGVVEGVLLDPGQRAHPVVDASGRWVFDEGDRLKKPLKPGLGLNTLTSEMWFWSEEWGEMRHKDQVAKSGTYTNPITGKEFQGAPLGRYGGINIKRNTGMDIFSYVQPGPVDEPYRVITSYSDGRPDEIHWASGRTAQIVGDFDLTRPARDNVVVIPPSRGTPGQKTSTVSTRDDLQYPGAHPTVSAEGEWVSDDRDPEAGGLDRVVVSAPGGVREPWEYRPPSSGSESYFGAPGDLWAGMVDWWFSHDIPTEGLPSGGGLMVGPLEMAKLGNFLKDALLPLMAGDIGLAGVGGLGPFDPLPIPAGQIIGKGVKGAKAGVRAVRGAVRGADEAAEAALRPAVKGATGECFTCAVDDANQLVDTFKEAGLTPEAAGSRVEIVHGNVRDLEGPHGWVEYQHGSGSQAEMWVRDSTWRANDRTFRPDVQQYVLPDGSWRGPREFYYALEGAEPVDRYQAVAGRFADELKQGPAGGVARETGEAAVRGDPAAGAWREDYPEAELVPIEFFDDMQLEDEFFDRDLVIGGDVYDPQVWLERPGAVAGEGMEGLKRDMAEHGLDHPLTVRVDPESGAMNLVDGNHRVVAARELGWGSVPVVVERGDDITRIRPSQVGVPTAGGVARETGEAAGRVSDEIEEWLADAPLAGEAEAFLKGRLSNQEVWDIIESKPEVRDIFLGNWDRMFREMREHGHIFGPDATASGRGYAERMGGGKFDPSNPEHLEEILSIGMPVDMQASLYLAGWGRPEGTKEAVEELLELLKRLEELGD